MSMDTDLDELRRDVRYLTDRIEILDCIAQHARGCDRHDVDLLTETYHSDGVDDHGTTETAGSDYAEWANSVHAATSLNHLHNVTTHRCEIDGDQAHAESYVLVTLLAPDAATATVMCGRYIDRLERRHGTWAIAHRTSTVELAFTADARLLKSEFFRSQGYIRGSRNCDDLSYERPLGSGSRDPERW
ncbi:MAG: hypothetical protein JWN46_1420 [Acidimicrobiales bacterium]|nr:hypothetical protein [Acidimicrobiales bacterium]